MIRLYRFAVMLPLIIAAYVGKSEPLQNVHIDLPVPASIETPVFSKEERYCVRDMVFGEAGSEPFEGKVAAASVAIFRSLSSTFPDDLCKVVRQESQFYGYRKQPREAKWLVESLRSVDYAIAHLGELPVVYYFHRKEIKGNYAYQFNIGNHTFYRRDRSRTRSRMGVLADSTELPAKTGAVSERKRDRASVVERMY